MTHSFSCSNTHVSSSIRTFPLLEQCREGLAGLGIEASSPLGWHQQVLCVAADILSNAGNALQANQDATMILLAAALTETTEAPPALDLVLNHTQGGVGRVMIRFAPEGEGASLEARALVTPLSPVQSVEKRLWVGLGSVPAEDICDVVATIAAHQNIEPGSMLSILGAGALLGFVQSMEAMEAASDEVRANGYGSDPHRFDALISGRIGQRLVFIPKAGTRSA